MSTPSTPGGSSRRGAICSGWKVRTAGCGTAGSPSGGGTGTPGSCGRCSDGTGSGWRPSSPATAAAGRAATPNSSSGCSRPAGGRERGAPSERGPALEAAPHVLGQLDAERELRLLLIGRDRVALDRRGEPALRAHAELLEGDVLRRLVETPPEVVLLLERPRLRRDQSQHHAHVLRHVPQQREIARAGVVELEEEAVVRQLVEDDVRDPRVAALGAPPGAEIAATQVGADGQVLRAVAERGLDQLDREPELGVGVLAARPVLRAQLLVAEIREAHVVEL